MGVVSPEVTPAGKTYLRSWGGTYEIKRDGRGCGVDGDLAGFVEAVSRDHVVVLYGDHQRDFEILAGFLGLEAKIF